MIISIDTFVIIAIRMIKITIIDIIFIHILNIISKFIL
jgi:hypothetical protein